MAKVFWKPGTMLYPLPTALVTCGTIDEPNALTIAWTGIINSDPPMTYISVRPSRYSYDIIKKSGEFVINLTHSPLLRAADYCGVKSGRDTNKIKDMNLELEPCQFLKAPMISNSPLSLECKVAELKLLGSHDMFIAEILSVNIDDRFLDQTGRFCLERSGIVSFCHGRYYSLGGLLGTFGFSVKKKKTKEKQASLKTKISSRKKKLSI